MKPVLVFCYANSADKLHLDLLKEESEQLLQSFSPLHDEEVLEIHREESARVKDLPGIFLRFAHRMCIFHYAGHAGEEELFLEGGIAYGEGLAQLLGQQKGQLAFVFLNGCSTHGHVKRLLELGVRAVIATSVPVGDTKAKEFARWFYQAIAKPENSLQNAFEYAVATLQTEHQRFQQVGITAVRGFELPHEKDGVFPWGLYYQEDQPETRDWKLADALENPFLGLPSLPESIRFPRHPFKGLDYFTREDARIFFGRGKWIQELFSRITDKDADPILLLCGQSGVGKSSLLHAGLWPRLEAAGWEIRYCRKGHLEYLEKHPLLASGRGQRGILWIFDQFEELVTLHPFQVMEYLTEFVQRLAGVFSSPPDSSMKILLSFRKEYVAEIEAELDKQPSLQDIYKRVYLEPIGKPGVEEVVRGITLTGLHKKRYGLTVAPRLPGLIANDITRDKQSNIAPALQILMTKMWEEAMKKSGTKPHFDESLYEQLKRQGLSLEDHLKKVLKELESSGEEARQSWARSGLVLDLLNYFVTPKLTAAEHAFEASIPGKSPGAKPIKEVYSHVEQLLRLIRFLQDKFLLTENAGDGTDATQNKKFRLSHDALGPIARSLFDASEQPGQRAWRIINAKGDYVLEQPDARRFSESDIEVILEGLQGMPAIEESLKKKIKDDEKYYQGQREKSFNLAYTAAERNIEHLEHEEALSNLNIAQREGLRPDEVREKGKTLVYPLAYLQSKASLEQAIQLIRSLPDGQGRHWESLAGMVKGLPERGLFEEVKAWLEKHEDGLHAKMQERFFPHLVKIPGGTFDMGAEGSERAFYVEEPVHTVSVDPFQLADTPVTCWQYGLYCLATGRPLPRDAGFGRGSRPVVNVSWYEAVVYANWLSQQHNLSPVYELPEIPADPNDLHQKGVDWDSITHWEADGYRLPTEAEWEFAASAKIEKTFFGGTKIKKWRFGNGKDVASPDEINFDASSGSKDYAIKRGWMSRIRKDKFRAASTPVKEFEKSNQNPFGLHDMSGNVYEWCWDWFSGDLSDQPDKYYQECKNKGTVHNPRGAKSGNLRVVRGGSWYDDAYVCRSCFRNWYLPFLQNLTAGFRVSRR